MGHRPMMNAPGHHNFSRPGQISAPPSGMPPRGPPHMGGPPSGMPPRGPMGGPMGGPPPNAVISAPPSSISAPAVISAPPKRNDDDDIMALLMKTEKEVKTQPPKQVVKPN